MIVDKESNVPNSLSIPSIASFVIRIKSKNHIPEASDFAKKEGLPFLLSVTGPISYPMITSRLSWLFWI